MEKCFEASCRISNQFFSVKTMADFRKSVYFFRLYHRPGLTLYLILYRATILRFQVSLQTDRFSHSGSQMLHVIIPSSVISVQYL